MILDEQIKEIISDKYKSIMWSVYFVSLFVIGYNEQGFYGALLGYAMFSGVVGIVIIPLELYLLNTTGSKLSKTLYLLFPLTVVSLITIYMHYF